LIEVAAKARYAYFLCMKRTSQVLLAMLLAMLLACGTNKSQPAQSADRPALPNGCTVQTFEDSPSMQTDNIGTVSARCDEALADRDCLRQLQDEVCALGGNVVWGVRLPPKEQDGKKFLSGRAARTREVTKP
jgi:hypothetical protein